MQADISAFELLQNNAHQAMGLSQTVAFNDRARLNRIRYLFENATDDETGEILKLIDDEMQYWNQQNKDTLTESQKTEAMEFLRLIEEMQEKLGTTMDDMFIEFPFGKPQD